MSKKKKSLKWYIRKDWWNFLDSIIPRWRNEACYDLDCELQGKEAQRMYTWLWWFILVDTLWGRE